MGELEQRNKSIVERFGEAINSGRLALLDELVAPHFVRHCQATPWVQISSLDSFKRFLEEDRAAVPDGQTTARFLIAEGEYVAMYGAYAGTHLGNWGPIPPSGKRFEIDIGAVFRIAGDKIAELWITWDNVALLTQIGHRPPQANTG